MTGMAEDEQVLETLRAMADQLHVIEDTLAKLAISLTAFARHGGNANES